MLITVCVIAYNEENTINNLLEDICRQDYDHSMMEILLVDGMSSDGTKRIMEEFAGRNENEHHHFSRVVILDNPKKTLPCGWNVALKEYKGDAILKIDAHASVPEDFVSKNVETLSSGEDISGGERPSIIDDSTPWKETLLLAETSMFGSSIAPYRRNPGKSYVNSMFHAAYRRCVFDRTGGFNENLGRTEDNEIHYRMRNAGFRLCFNPEIVSYQHIRSSLKKMLHQKYSNGYWIGLTAGVCPGCLSLYHFVPFAFVMAILLTTVGTIMAAAFSSAAGIAGVVFGVIRFLTILMWSAYWLAAILMSVTSVINAKKEQRNITNPALPLLFFMLHVSYGVGTLIGIVKMPRWRKGLRNETD